MYKKILSLFVVLFSLTTYLSTNLLAQNLPVIYTSSNEFHLIIDFSDDTPLLFGYVEKDINSEKAIAFSSFTEDIDGNPHDCILGAYYETEDIKINYLGTEGNWVKLSYVHLDFGEPGEDPYEFHFYMKKEHVEFE